MNRHTDCFRIMDLNSFHHLQKYCFYDGSDWIDFAEDENLLQYCADVFTKENIIDVLLEYLCRYYNGATKVMTAVFKSADSFGIDTWALSERIVVQMLYTNEFVDCADRIYNCYKTKGSGRIKEAYLSYFSYYSFTKDVIAPEGFFLDP